MHFEKMGRIVVLLALLYLYFNINEYLVPAFKMKKPEEAHLTQLFAGEFAPLFWFAIIVGMIIPIFILIFKKGRKPLPMFIAGVMVVVGAWFKRYLIVTPTLLHPFFQCMMYPNLITLFPKLGRVGYCYGFAGRGLVNHHFFCTGISNYSHSRNNKRRK